MNVLIVGAGKSGVYLAEKLRAGHKVTMIDIRPDRAEYVAKHMPDVRMVRGDGCEPSVLDRANAGQSDLVVAMTCGNYDKPGMEQNRVNLAVLADVVFPSLA